MRSILLSFALLCLCVLTLKVRVADAAIVNGQTIGIDFGTNPSDNNFNNSSSGSGADSLLTLTDLSGATVTGVTYAYTASGAGNFSNNDGNIGTITGLPSPFDVSNYSDFTGTFGGASQVITMTFSGLDDALTYTVVGVSAFQGGSYTQNFSSGAASVNVQSQQNNPSALLGNLHTDGAGHLVVLVSNVAGSNAFVNAVTLTAVPEPGSMVLLGLGAVGLAVAARRRRSA